MEKNCNRREKRERKDNIEKTREREYYGRESREERSGTRNNIREMIDV